MADKVISLKDAKSKKKDEEIKPDESSIDFNAIMEYNKKKKEKEEKERLAANKSVLRSYRIKH